MELSITEAATLLVRSVRTVRAQVVRGELPGFKRSGQWVIRKEALPLSEAQRAALQQKAETLRGALEDALPRRLAQRGGQTRRGLADLDAFTRCAALLLAVHAASPEDAPGGPLERARRLLERAAPFVAEASAQFGPGRPAAGAAQGAGHLGSVERALAHRRRGGRANPALAQAPDALHVILSVPTTQVRLGPLTFDGLQAFLGVA
jgi:hypothetical protein